MVRMNDIEVLELLLLKTKEKAKKVPSQYADGVMLGLSTAISFLKERRDQAGSAKVIPIRLPPRG